MAKLTVKSGAATRSEYIFINDSTSTTGAGLTGLLFNSASLTAYYVTERGTPTPITLVTLASATAAYSSGGFVAVDATNLPGVYRLDVPAAVFATTKGVVMLKGATNMVPVLLEYDVVAYDPADTVRLGLTAIPNVAQGTTGSISIGNATGQVTVVTNNDKTGYALSATQTFDVTGNRTGNLSGSVGSVTGSVGSVVGAVGSVTGAVGSVTGAVGSVTGNVGGNVTGSVGSLTATAVQNIWDDSTVNNTAVGSIGKLIADNLNAPVGNNTPALVWANATRILTAGTNIVLAKGTGITGLNDITTANIWSEALPGTYTSGQAGFKLNAAGSTADPWSTALPGVYSAGSAGNIIGNMVANTWSAGTRTLTSGANIVLAKNTGITGFNDITALSVWDVLASTVSVTSSMGLQLKTNVDATVSSRLASASYTAPLTTATTASAVWDAPLASYSTINTFGGRSIRATSGSVTNEVVMNASNHIAANVHQMQADVVTASALATDAVTEITKGIWNQDRATASTGGSIPTSGTFGFYIDKQLSTISGGTGGGSSVDVRPGPFQLKADNSQVGDPLDIVTGSACNVQVQCVDANGTGVDLTSATVQAKVYSSTGTLVTTYTATVAYAVMGHVLIPLTTTVTNTVGTYIVNVISTVGSTVTVYGPLKMYVRQN